MKSAARLACLLAGLILGAGIPVIAPAPALPVAQAGFRPYLNARFGYRIDYPADFIPQGESDNGDGQVFLGQDGAELRVWGGYNIFQETPASALQEELRRSRENQRRVTYQAVGRDFFVVSGYEPVRVSGAEPFGQRIFYLKTVVRPSLQAGFEFVYPASRRERYDRDVEAIARSLRLADP
ncbi:hypothetical protein [Synechococcus sp. R6-6]|uniref:hypothetical protein n=1 Tax=unclassified Synechococcus TaxID=2626047 RepID=UPI0039C08CBC